MKFKKLTASLLLAACTFACACGDKGGSNGPATQGVINEPTTLTGYVDGMLHDVNVDFDNPVSDFAVNGQSAYQVVAGSMNSTKAAAYVVENVKRATGAVLAMVEQADVTEVTDNTQYIFVGCEDLYKELGGEMPDYDTIGVSGYQIVTVGKNVFINAYTLGGYQMGVLAFLRETLGYDMLSDQVVIFEKDGAVMPAMDIVERPDFDYRQPNGISTTTSEQFGMGYTYIDPMISTGSSWMHNWKDFVNPDDESLPREWTSNDETKWQGCWTSRGNKELYTGLINHLANKIKGFLIANPTKDSIMIGQHDIGGNTPQVQNCKCDACKASYEYYGTMAGAWLSMSNRVSVLVDEWLQTPEAIAIFGGVKEWHLVELVYHTSVQPPVEKDSNGIILDENGCGTPKVEKWFDEEGNMYDWDEAWTAEDGTSLESETVAAWTAIRPDKRLYCAPSVESMFAASASNWVHAYTEPENAGWKILIDGWSGCGGDIYIWAYALNSQYILYPYNSFDTSWETTRYFKKRGALYMFWQGQYGNTNNAGFTQLRNYLDSKVEFDVNADYQYYVNKFFKYFYGTAGETMQRFFEEVQAQNRYIEKYNQVAGGIHNIKLGYAENWPEGLLRSWMSMMAKAYEEVEEAYRVSDPEMYKVYTDNIMTEELFPMYALITTYPDSFKTTDLKAMRLQFIDNFYALNNKWYAENRMMSDIIAEWDLD
ncbi:MAG: DUF4838 domain-containing protein [Clostridia bacterium]|nr:DUF4838 domain-containing protein [Clostridia bacterium]